MNEYDSSSGAFQKPPPGFAAGDDQEIEPMPGKIIEQGKCHYCPGSYLIIQHQGEDHQRIFHSKQHECPKFEADPQAYRAFHNLPRRERRARASNKKGRGPGKLRPRKTGRSRSR